MSSNTGGGPVPGGPDQFTQQSMRAQQLSNKGAQITDLDSFIQALLEQTGNIVGKIGGFNPKSLLSTGVFANAKIEDAAIKVDSQINKGAVAFTAQGAATIFTQLAGLTQRPDFSNIVAAAIEPMQSSGIEISAATPVAMADLGNLAPPSTPSMDRGTGMGMMA